MAKSKTKQPSPVVRIVDWRNLTRMDWFMPIIVLILAVIGWVTLYSATEIQYESYFVTRQMAAFGIGVLIAALILCTDYRFVVALAPIMYLAILVMLYATLSADAIKGSSRWLNLGPVSIQPSELSKFVMVYVLAWYFNLVGDRIKKLPFVILTFVIAGPPILLILGQPDLGTAVCLIPLTGIMLFLAGSRIWHLVFLVLAGIVVLLPFVYFQIHDFDPDPKLRSTMIEAAGPYDLKYHQKKRIHSFLFADEGDNDGDYQQIQSTIAVGSGGLKGKGFQQGTQTRLSYLPYHYTDFIFAHYAEERGFVGCAILMCLYAALLLRGLMFARECPDMMGTQLAVGVIVILTYHSVINIAINIDLLPVTGLPLPFMSWGRTFYLTTMACIGILLSVPMRKKAFVY